MTWQNGKIHKKSSQANYHDWNHGRSRGDENWRISRSELMQMLDCGEMFMAGGRPVSGKSISIGSLVDCLLTSPDEFKSTYVIQPETYKTGGEELPWNGRTKICKDWIKAHPGEDHPDTYTTETIVKAWSNNSNTCKDWIREQREDGKIIITEREMDEANRMAISVRHKAPARGNPMTLGQLIEICETQLVITADWHDPATDKTIPCRAMLDLARDLDSRPIVYDLKTSQEVNKRKFRWSCRDYHYDVQSWMYTGMLGAALDYLPPIPFGIIAVRNSQPYLVATYAASGETMNDGEDKFIKAMRRYSDALRFGFTGYTDGFEEI